jgi:DNA polymerase V
MMPLDEHTALPRSGQQTSGFPSPAEDYLEAPLDVRELVVKHPTATFFLEVEGEAMGDAGIHAGDILVVDRALDALPGAIVVAAIDGELLVRRVRSLHGESMTLFAVQAGEPIRLVTDALWGVVTWVLHRCQ